MNRELINKLKNTFKHDFSFENFPDFITDIHFPCFKGLAPNSEINFNFPLTVLVGENGCGKSSVLQALETAPEGSSYSQKWFSTRVDPIPEEPRPAFWYSYNSSEAKKNVQILNLRIKHDNNPDYWEPSRPVVKYGMKSFPKEMAKTAGASGTRWNGTKRNVLYLDFRGELSAFDKYFYFGEKPNTITLKTKQDYIRYYSVYLKGIIDGWVKTGFKYRGKKKVEKVKEEGQNLSSFYYIPSGVQTDGGNLVINPKPQDNSSVIDKRRIWMYRGYSAVVVSMPFLLYSTGRYVSTYNSYALYGSSVVTKEEADNWLMIRNVSIGVTAAAGVFFFTELVRYLHAASAVLPVTARPASERTIKKAEERALKLTPPETETSEELEESGVPGAGEDSEAAGLLQSTDINTQKENMEENING